MARISRFTIYDKLHRFTVTGLIGFTALSSVYLTYRFAMWWMYRKPQIAEKTRLYLEGNVAKEQDGREAELLQQQKDAEMFRSR